MAVLEMMPYVVAHYFSLLVFQGQALATSTRRGRAVARSASCRGRNARLARENRP